MKNKYNKSRKEIKMKKGLMKIVWLFTIGSFVGYIVETMSVIIQGHFEVRQGLIYGPFIPVYGIGTTLYYLSLLPFKFKNFREETKKNNIRNIFVVFIITAIMGGITEFLCSFLQEKVFGTVSWDYSNMKFNICGRTNLKYSIYWGLLGIFYYFVGIPSLIKADKLFDKSKKARITTGIIAAIMIVDIIISILACYRQYERRKNIEPRNIIEQAMDNHYTDEYLSRIYINNRER